VPSKDVVGQHRVEKDGGQYAKKKYLKNFKFHLDQHVNEIKFSPVYINLLSLTDLALSIFQTLRSIFSIDD
jgi:hypothetical protein